MNATWRKSSGLVADTTGLIRKSTSHRRVVNPRRRTSLPSGVTDSCTSSSKMKTSHVCKYSFGEARRASILFSMLPDKKKKLERKKTKVKFQSQTETTTTIGQITSQAEDPEGFWRPSNVDRTYLLGNISSSASWIS